MYRPNVCGREEIQQILKEIKRNNPQRVTELKPDTKEVYSAKNNKK